MFRSSYVEMECGKEYVSGEWGICASSREYPVGMTPAEGYKRLTGEAQLLQQVGLGSAGRLQHRNKRPLVLVREARVVWCPEADTAALAFSGHQPLRCLHLVLASNGPAGYTDLFNKHPRYRFYRNATIISLTVGY